MKQTITLPLIAFVLFSCIPQEAPMIPVVSTGEITNITTTTASCSGNVTADGGAEVTARGVCWSISENPTVSGSKTTNGTDTGTFAADLTNLTANTTYYVRTYATNSIGTAYGEQRSFKTAEEEVAPPTDLGDGFFMHSAGRVIATHYKDRSMNDLLAHIYSKFRDEIVIHF